MENLEVPLTSPTPHSFRSEETNFPRGIKPETLLGLILNTAPYLAEWPIPEGVSQGHLRLVLSSLAQLKADPNLDLAPSHELYFAFCVATHFTTVATFVPTDVDNQIRFKLWHPALPPPIVEAMVATVIEAKHWDNKALSARWLISPGNRLVEGHAGEWFSIAAAAYGASRRKLPKRAEELLALIEWEIENEALAFQDFADAGDGIGALKACTLLAHNLGDLWRVIEMWTLPEDDRLHQLFLQSYQSKPYAKSLKIASDMNRDLMAIENHRHFAARPLKPLRRSPELLLPLGPFFDDWGKQIGKHPVLASEEIPPIAEALIDGWERLKGPVGYARALAGIEMTYAGGLGAIAKGLPTRVAKKLMSGPLRQLCAVPQERFEMQWKNAALKKLKA